MNIGELFVVLGAKTDGSWAQAQQRIRAMAQLANQKAREMAAVARAEAQQQARDMAAAFKANAAAARAQAREMAAAHREAAAAARQAAKEQVAAAKQAAKEQAAAVKQQWADIHVGVKARIKEVQAANNIDWMKATGSPFAGGIDWSKATGDPFAPGGNGNGGKGNKRKRNGKGEGGGGGGGRRGNRLGLLGEASAFRRALFGAGVYQAVTTFGELADTYTNLQNRIGTITTSQEQANKVFNRLREVAANTRSSLETTAEAYVRIKNATDGMKLSDEDRFKFVERLNMAMATSGASTAEMSSGLTQMTQALAKGKLDGDEFRSIAENMPNILKILQKHLKVTEGQLRRMSRSGELTREKIVESFLAANDIANQYNKTAPTFASKWQKFKDDMMVSFGELAKNADLLKSFEIILDALSTIFVKLAKALAPIIIGIGSFIQGLRDGKVWAYALAAIIGLTLLPRVVSLVTWLVKLPAILSAISKARFLGIGADLASVGAAYGLGGGGGAKAATAARTASSGAGAGAAGAGAAGAAGAAGVLGPIALAFAAAYGIDLVTGGPIKEVGPGGVLDLDNPTAGIERFRQYTDPSYIARRQQTEANQVTINMGGVTINAKDIDDAAKQMMDQANRHAAAAFNR